MTIRIEVTGASIPEVADKLLALGRSLYNTAINDADDAAREALQAKRAVKPSKAKTDGAAPEPTPEPAPEPAPEIDAAPEPAAVLDFEKDVTPVVLAAVKAKGKPWVHDILSQFGVERASQVPDERFGELVALLREGME